MVESDTNKLDKIIFRESPDLTLRDLNLYKGQPALLVSDAKDLPMPLLLFSFHDFSIKDRTTGRYLTIRAVPLLGEQGIGNDVFIVASRAYHMWPPHPHQILNFKNIVGKEGVDYPLDRAYAGSDAIKEALFAEREGFELYTEIFSSLLQGRIKDISDGLTRHL